MKILCIGPEEIRDEFKAKFHFPIDFISAYTQANNVHFKKYDAIFDLFLLENAKLPDHYHTDEELIIFCNAATSSLAAFYHSAGKMHHFLIGFNGLPTMINREFMEVSLLNYDKEGALKRICKKLNSPYKLVEDRVGLVTPRIVAMIINEAYFTVMDGTASRTDIDKAMKLGTNYPYGPFEWCEKIGIQNIYQLLEAVHRDTGDERYKICPLLRREYLINTGQDGSEPSDG